MSLRRLGRETWKGAARHRKFGADSPRLRGIVAVVEVTATSSATAVAATLDPGRVRRPERKPIGGRGGHRYAPGRPSPGNEEVVSVNVSTWVLLTGVTVGR